MKLIQVIIVLFLFPPLCVSETKSPNLHPSSNYWGRNIKKAPVQITRLSRNRRLAAVGDTIYMLDDRKQIIWTWTTNGPPLTDFPVVDSKGTIYAIGYDLMWVALDSATGREKWRATANGRAVYSQIELYRNDKYLVVTDMQGYRDSSSDRTLKDGLTLCRGNEILWTTDLPARTKIEIRGGKVFGVIRRNNQIRRQEIMIPKNASKPIGRVSVMAATADQRF